MKILWQFLFPVDFHSHHIIMHLIKKSFVILCLKGFLSHSILALNPWFNLSCFETVTVFMFFVWIVEMMEKLLINKLMAVVLIVLTVVTGKLVAGVVGNIKKVKAIEC